MSQGKFLKSINSFAPYCECFFNYILLIYRDSDLTPLEQANHAGSRALLKNSSAIYVRKIEKNYHWKRLVYGGILLLDHPFLTMSLSFAVDLHNYNKFLFARKISAV